jgi:hypothetical protein
MSEETKMKAVVLLGALFVLSGLGGVVVGQSSAAAGWWLIVVLLVLGLLGWHRLTNPGG